MENRFTKYRKVVQLLKEVEQENDLKKMVIPINKLVDIYTDHKKDVKAKELAKDFKPVNGIDFNIWAYYTEDTLKSAYDKAMGRYHDIHWELKGWNAY